MTADKIEELKTIHKIKDVADRLGMRVPNNNSATRCFAHEDKHPSFVFLTDVNRFECKSCGIKGDVIELVRKVKGMDFMQALHFLDPLIVEKIPLTGKEAEEYLASRRLNPETLEKLGIHVRDNEVVIPLSTGKKYRIFGKDTKFRQDKGTAGTIFKAGQAKDKIILCEGELDAVKVFQETSYPAWSGTGGSETFKDEWIEEFRNIKKIFICYDNDKAGREGAAKAASILGTERCWKIELPDYAKDITQVFLLGEDNFDDLLKNAKPTRVTLLNLIPEHEEETFLVGTGFPAIDQDVSFSGGNAYIVGGSEKSGKSAFCMNIANHALKEGHKISYVNTEFTNMEFLRRMTSIYRKSLYESVDSLEIRDYANKFSETFFYSGIGVDKIEFEPIYQKVVNEVENGTKIVFFDNVATFVNSSEEKVKDYVVQRRLMTKLIKLAKEKGIIVFVVVHAKDTSIENTVTSKIKHIIDSKDPNRIFEDTITVMARPNTTNLYGGASILSQFSGAILIWRPFLKFGDKAFNKATCIIFESFRNAPTGLEFIATFKGEVPTFQIDYDAI